MHRHLRWLFALTLLGALLGSPVLAQEGEPEDEEEQAAKLFAEGRKLYGEGKYKEAIEQLLKAYALRPAPPILLNIARTYEKLEDKRQALKFYKEFLLKARMNDPNRPQVETVVKELEKEVEGKTGAVTSAAGTDTPTALPTGEGDGPGITTRQQLIHTPVDSAKVNQSITILAELPPQVEADQVILYFRKAGETDFRQLPLQAQGEAYVAQIPARYVTSTSLQYYIEATKGTGRNALVSNAATKTTPNIIVIEGGLAPTIGPVKEVTIRSPYWTWMWVSAGVTAAFIAGGVTTFVLARDRQSALENWVRQQSCKDACAEGKARPAYSFDIKARDWESEGKTFTSLSQAFLVLGILAAGTTGTLLYLDRKHVKEERARRWRLNADAAPPPRFSAAPYATPHGAGLWGQLSF